MNIYYPLPKSIPEGNHRDSQSNGKTGYITSDEVVGME